MRNINAFYLMLKDKIMVSGKVFTVVFFMLIISAHVYSESTLNTNFDQHVKHGLIQLK